VSHEIKSLYEYKKNIPLAKVPIINVAVPAHPNNHGSKLKGIKAREYNMI
jgi:hypothetical protein